MAIVETPKPEMGRIVRYQDLSQGERAAIIAFVREDSVDITAFLQGQGAVPVSSVRYDAEGRPGTWRWPPRR